MIWQSSTRIESGHQRFPSSSRFLEKFPKNKPEAGSEDKETLYKVESRPKPHSCSWKSEFDPKKPQEIRAKGWSRWFYSCNSSAKLCSNTRQSFISFNLYFPLFFTHTFHTSIHCTYYHYYSYYPSCPSCSCCSTYPCEYGNRYAPLQLPTNPAAMPQDYQTKITYFDGTSAFTALQHTKKMQDYFESYEIDDDGVRMKIFCRHFLYINCPVHCFKGQLVDSLL